MSSISRSSLPFSLSPLSPVATAYLCSPDANVYDIDFTRFCIRETESFQTLFEINKPPNLPAVADDQDTDASRFVRYQFPPEFLDLETVGATIEFTVGEKPIKKFRMIERHFYKDHHLKTFDFEFGFCIPRSKNSCEHIYEFPLISEQLSEYPFYTPALSILFSNNQMHISRVHATSLAFTITLYRASAAGYDERQREAE